MPLSTEAEEAVEDRRLLGIDGDGVGVGVGADIRDGRNLSVVGWCCWLQVFLSC